ncbi:MAG: biotin/lipoyl-binding protein [Candidatus Pacebacteria bacterium]|nr:biotin/lipoyl-binding protein [Candidatus Paceibacterota bacterium]
MHERISAVSNHLSKPVVALGGAGLIALAAIGIAWQASAVTPSGQYAAATFAPITAVGGASSDLSFQISGQTVSIPVVIGQKVSSGTTLVVLDQSALLAGRAGAVANLEAAQARLAALKAGTRPEQLAINQTTATQAEESLRDAVRSAYIGADDAIHNKADQFFTDPRTSSAAFSFTVSDKTLQNTVETGRVSLEPILSAWSAQVNSPAFATSDPLADAKLAQANLIQISAFLDTVASALARTPSSSAVPAATLQGYQTTINTVRLSISNSLSAITGSVTALQNAQGALVLAQVGPTAHDIAAAQAAVDAAQAALRGIDVSLRQSVLSAPIAGTITALNVHLGQTVTPGQIIISIESSGGSSDRALVVPASSIIRDGDQVFVLARSATGSPVKTIVSAGLVGDDGMTEIVSGLNEGDEVLTFGSAAK